MMQVREELRGNVDILSLHGKLMGAEDVNELHLAIKSCIEKRTNQIVVDLQDVNWMGSVGIGILICCLTTVRNAGGDLRLSGPSKKVLRLLKMTRLDGIFQMYPDTDQAVQSFDVH